MEKSGNFTNEYPSAIHSSPFILIHPHSDEWVKSNPHSSPFTIHLTCPEFCRDNFVATLYEPYPTCIPNIQCMNFIHIRDRHCGTCHSNYDSDFTDCIVSYQFRLRFHQAGKGVDSNSNSD